LRAIFSDDLDAIVEQHGSNPFAFFAEDHARDLTVAVKFRALHKVILDVINTRRAQGRDGDDFLGALMAARDKDSGEGMSDREIIDEVTTLIVAGHETSAGTLNWVWYLLARHPRIEQSFHTEVDGVLGGNMPAFSDLPQLGYTRQIIEEALRLYPPVWLFSRKAVGPDTLGPYTVPKGTNIFIAPYFLHRNTQFWPDPEAFSPERFGAEAVKQRHRFAFIPFSAGPRRCIGDFFGIVEMQIHLGLMGQKVRLRYIEDRPIELEPAINLRTKHPILMKIEKR
jgi:cytochrome P450